MTVIRIDIISDIVCVWCFIGKRVLDRAIALYRKTYPGGKDDTFEIRWRPYFLDYNRLYPSPESVDKSEVAKVKLRDWSAEKKETASRRVQQAGQAVGISFRWGGKIGSTRDAHRLIHHAQQSCGPGTVDSVVEGIFQGYHQLEQDISSREVLCDIARSAGLEPGAVKAYLESDEDGEEVDSSERTNRQTAPQGVPLFIIQGAHQIDGAQDPQDFMEIFVQVKEAET